MDGCQLLLMQKDVLKTKFEQNISILFDDTQGQQKDVQRQM